jgi:hypothetical protein
MGNDKFNILIVGKGAAAGALCRKLLQNPDTGKIFITESFLIVFIYILGG